MKKKSEMLRESRSWLAKSIPNFLTICNSLCGFIAILITLQAYHLSSHVEQTTVFCWSVYMIFFAMVFDAFDGFTARLLHVASMYGIQMDSLSDMVTFGVAPATLVAVMAHNVREFETLREFIPVCFLCSVYIGCAALRLATYNVHAIVEKKNSEKFFGLPSPGAAAAVCSVVLQSSYIPETHSAKVLSFLMRFLPWYAAILGLLMVSTVPYTHFAKWVVSTKHNKKRLLLLLLLLIVWAAVSLAGYGLAVPIVLINLYVIWGPVVYFLRKLGLLKQCPESSVLPSEQE